MTVAVVDPLGGVVRPTLGVVPESGTLCGLPDALSVSVRVAVPVPSATGLNNTEMEQLAPGAKEFPQVFVC